MKTRHITLIIIASAIVLLLCVLCVYAHFGGFGTGECADVDEFARYSTTINDIHIPDSTRIVALGEATHGNKEFQQLKLDVFRLMVEKYGVRAFALEADYGCCVKANGYVQGGEGSAESAAADLGFKLYRTDQMAELLRWMRQYNDTATQKLLLYGFDMQNIELDYDYLVQACGIMGVDTSLLVNTCDSKQAVEVRRNALLEVKEAMMRQSVNEDLPAVHLADVLLQYLELEVVYKSDMNSYAPLRDSLMAENTLWIMRQEQLRGNRVIFVSGHNGHIEQSGTYNGGKPVMGNILARRVGSENYFAIGTDFHKTRCNMPKSPQERTTFTAYSHDPLAKAAMKSGKVFCWLDFANVADDSKLRKHIDGNMFMGSLGENQLSPLNWIVMSFMPSTYRIYRSPVEMYDGMIFVPECHPTVLKLD